MNIGLRKRLRLRASGIAFLYTKALENMDKALDDRASVYCVWRDKMCRADCECLEYGISRCWEPATVKLVKALGYNFAYKMTHPVCRMGRGNTDVAPNIVKAER